MPKNTHEKEINIQKAISALLVQEKPNIAKTAREFAVPYSTLAHRWKGRKSLLNRSPTNRKLDTEQEKALCVYIDQLDKARIHIKPAQITKSANFILSLAHTDPSTLLPKIGEHWVKRFLHRHPEYYRRRRRALDIERKQALDKRAIEKWFSEYQTIITKRGINPSDIYNFDETGFRIGVGRD
ncbi:hypothetical protein N7488_006331 [Penicillium malachiteum]|nr:hypothetical protein N7488_006331 [Penicillium malachiteum]